MRSILPGLDTLAYTGIRLLSLPILMGLGYELIRLAGKHNNIITRALSAPGLWGQRITTREPTDDMLEVAIISLKCALRDESEEFKEFFESKPWEKKENEGDGAAESDALTDGEVEKTENSESGADENDA